MSRHEDGGTLVRADHEHAEAMLRIYTDRGYVPAGLGHCLMLAPFWGTVVEHNGFNAFARAGRAFLSLVDDPAEADVALLPFDGRYVIDARQGCQPEARRLAEAFVARAREAGLKTLVLINSDFDTPLALPETIVLRTSLNTVTRGHNEFVLPAWHEDLLGTHFEGRLPVRDKRSRPVVGFCGHVASGAPPIKKRVKRVLQRLGRPAGIYIPHNDGTYLRRDAVRALERSSRVEANFLLRDQYFGGGLNDGTALAQVRQAYLDNIVHSDYTLCLRGYGNFSFRFYEVMSLGRVPLLIDTDCDLPLSFLHDYGRYCVVVPERDLRRADEYVAAFHEGLTDAAFVELQREVRCFWERWLSPEGFFRCVAARWREFVARAEGVG